MQPKNYFLGGSVLCFYLARKGGEGLAQYQIITNNPMVKEHFANKCPLQYADISFMEIFYRVRDLVQQGHKLLTHPLAGSVKPNETPYRSIMISLKSEGQVDTESEVIIEECIIAGKKFPPLERKWSDRVIEDFQYIDFTLISNVLSVHG